MSARRSHRSSRALLAVAALTLALGGNLAPASASPSSPSSPASAARSTASAPSEGSKLESLTRFTVDPAGNAVHVVYEATVTNLEPPTYAGYYTSFSYLPRLGVPVMKEAVNVAASRQDGSPLAVAMEGTDSAYIAVAVIDFEPDLYYQDVAAIRLTYDLPPMSARAESFTRLNDAFATFPVFAVGDDGFAAVEVVVPERYEVELIGSKLERSERDGQQVFTKTAIADTDTFGVDVVARDDEKLISESVDLGDHDVVVLGWPGDGEWAAFVAEQVGEGVPQLSEMLGLAWPADEDLEIVETVSPYLYGYAGWYQPLSSLIEIGDELDQHVILHELSHLWFNVDLYTSRWINEGLADVYSTRAMAALGDTPDTPDPIDAAAPGAVALAVWDNPGVQTEESFAQEGYGYNASWSVIEQIAAEIGLDKLSAVVRASRARALPYPAAGDERVLPFVHTWHQFLDTLVSVGGSTIAEPLFRNHVVAPAEIPEFEARTAARAALAQLQTDVRGWSPPFSVRRAMSMWDFSEATTLMERTRAVQPTLDALATELDALGLALPARVRREYERSDDPDELASSLESHLAAVRSFTAAVDALADHRGPLPSVGLAFTHPDLRLLEARQALEAGDFAAAARASEQVSDRVAEANASALARAIAVLLLLAMATFVRRSGAQVPPELAGPMRHALSSVGRGLPTPQSLWRFLTERHSVPR